MIRIDLGEQNRKQGESIRKVASQLKLQQPYEELLAKFDNDVSRLVAFLVSIPVAIFPYLFVGEYERVVTANFNRKIAAIDKELTVVQSEIQGLMPFKTELESYEKQTQQVSQRLTVIRSLLDARGTPVTILDALSQSLPEGVWLENITFDSGDKAGEKISLMGKAFNNEDVSDYVDRLALSAYLKNVKLNSVDPGNVAGRDVRAFTIDLEVNAPSPVAPDPARNVGSK